MPFELIILPALLCLVIGFRSGLKSSGKAGKPADQQQQDLE